jgi:hypothetical protein
VSAGRRGITHIAVGPALRLAVRAAIAVVRERPVVRERDVQPQPICWPPR